MSITAPINRPDPQRIIETQSSRARLAQPERYVLKRRLRDSREGEPDVWLAHDKRLACDVVFKQFPRSLRPGYERVLTLLRAGLPHVPHLIDAFDTGGGGAWLTRAYVPGSTIDRLALVPPRVAIRMTAQIAWLTHRFHSARPESLVLGAMRLGDFVSDPDGQIWLIGGEDAYPSFAGDGGPARDIQAVGVLALSILTGRGIETDSTERLSLLEGLPSAIADVLHGAVNECADKRYGSMKWFAQALDTLGDRLERGSTGQGQAGVLEPPEPIFHPVNLEESVVAHAVETMKEPELARTRLAWMALKLREECGADSLCALDSLDIEPYRHQLDTALQVVTNPAMGAGAILADEVGLGKTIEALIVAQELRLRGLAKSILIVASPSGAPQWLAEASARLRRNAYEPGFRLYHSAKDAGYPLLIVSSATLKQERHFAQFRDRRFDLVIVDEAHQCCAASGTLSTLGRSVAKLNRLRLLLLTATPLGNRLWDLYTLIDLVRPGLLGSLKAFQHDFLSNEQASDAGLIAAIRALRTRAQTVMIRHKRTGLSELITPSLKHWILRTPRSSVESKTKAAADLICGEWADERVVVFGRTGPPREALARELARRAPGRAVILFRGNRRESRGFERHFNDFAGSVMISGDTIAEGMNWQRARRLLHLDAPLTPLIWEQRVGRIFRLGQLAEELAIVHLAAEGSGEAQMLNIYRRDLGLFDLPIGEAASVLDHLTDPKWRNLETPARALLRAGADSGLAEEMGAALRLARVEYDRRLQESALLDELAFGGAW